MRPFDFPIGDGQATTVDLDKVVAMRGPQEFDLGYDGTRTVYLLFVGASDFAGFCVSHEHIEGWRRDGDVRDCSDEAWAFQVGFYRNLRSTWIGAADPVRKKIVPGQVEVEADPPPIQRRYVARG